MTKIWNYSKRPRFCCTKKKCWLLYSESWTISPPLRIVVYHVSHNRDFQDPQQITQNERHLKDGHFSPVRQPPSRSWLLVQVSSVNVDKWLPVHISQRSNADAKWSFLNTKLIILKQYINYEHCDPWISIIRWFLINFFSPKTKAQ